jgi:hypothetical protein
MQALDEGEATRSTGWRVTVRGCLLGVLNAWWHVGLLEKGLKKTVTTSLQAKPSLLRATERQIGLRGEVAIPLLRVTTTAEM